MAHISNDPASAAGLFVEHSQNAEVGPGGPPVLELSLSEGPVLPPLEELSVVDPVVPGSPPDDVVASAGPDVLGVAVVPAPVEPSSVPEDSTEEPP